MGGTTSVFQEISRAIGKTITVYDNKKIQFRDSGLYVYSSADGQLDVVADTTVAISGAVTMDSTLEVTGDLTVNGDFVFGDASADTMTVAGDIVYGASTADYLVDMNAATPGVADIRLSNGTTIVATSASETTITETTITLSGAVKLDGTVTFDDDGTLADASDVMTITQDTITLVGSTAINLTGDTAISGTLSCTGDLTLSNNTCTITHSGTTSLTITSTSGTVGIEGVVFTGDAISSASDITGSGTIQGGTLTDGTFSVSSGAFSSVASITDGTASWSSNNLSGFSSISGTTITDGTISISSGTITSATLTIASSTKLDVNGMIDVLDELSGGASNGNIIKKTLQSGEAYTGTTAGLMVKNYCADNTVTVPSGEFTGLYVNLKGLHVDPGNNTSLISAHVHASNTTTVHAGLWLYGDMTNGVKMSGSTLTSAIDISEATAVTHLFDLPAGGTAPVTAATGAVGNTTHKIAIDVGGTTRYLVAYDDIAAS